MNGFTIQQKLPSLNEYVNANRRNRYAGAKFKEDIESVICMYIYTALQNKSLIPVGDVPCEIHIDWYERTKKRDADNIQSSQKFILDALQKCGVIKNDNRKCVKQIHHLIHDSDVDFVFVRLVPYES